MRFALQESEDDDYEEEGSDSDYVDSDFDIDENDEPRSDMEDDDEGKRKKRVVTKAYKEPVKEDEKATRPPQPKRPRLEKVVPGFFFVPEAKKMRSTTLSKRQETEKRERERQLRERMMKEIAAKKNVQVVRRLTQEELLEEAKQTEQLNLASLKAYERMEYEKRRVKVQKQVHKGPMIVFQSMTMPHVAEAAREGDISVPRKCSRNFITFTHDSVYEDNLPKCKRKLPQKQYCPITGFPAKYFDPLTLNPYANIKAFRLLRELYNKYHNQPKNASRTQKTS